MTEEKAKSKRGKTKKIVYFSVIGALVAFLFVYELFLAGWCKTQPVSSSVDMIITRFCGAVVAVLLLNYLGYNVFHKPCAKGLAAAAPCLIVALCNPPMLSLVCGSSSLNYSGKTLAGYTAVFAAECILVATFEETLFRGAIFLSLLETKRENGKRIFLAVLQSSLAFALVHLLNLFSSSPAAVLLQVGYSFLLGGMCAYTLLCTRNIVFPIIVHAVFNFCGQFVERFGYGDWATLPMMTFTVILGLIVAAIVITGIFKTPPPRAEVFFRRKRESEEAKSDGEEK